MIERRAVIGLLAMSLLAACGGGPPAPKVPSDEKTSRAEIDKTVDGWHAAAARNEESHYFSFFAPTAVYLGTDATERWTLEEFRRFAHPHFDKGKAWAFKPTRRTIVVAPSGDVAWFDEDLESKNLGPLRGTGVVLKTGSDEKWKIVHYSLAVTVPNEQMDAVKRLLGSEK
jgi:ketosteroid isomerase-like protein